MDKDYKKINLSEIYSLDYFTQFRGNEKWKNSIDCPDCGLPFNYGVIGEYDNINKYENKIEGGQSQNGEDGLLNYIFSQIGTTNKYYVEFGAGDGTWLSNAYYFRVMQGWNGLLLEGNKNEVEKGRKQNKDLNLHSEMVTKSNINSLFKKYNVPKSFDLLSIDVDSYDYWIWQGLTEYEPNVLIIETNAGLPNNIPLIISPNANTSLETWTFGVNLLAIYDLAKEKGYEFVTTIRWNAVFVKKDLFYKLKIEPISREQCIKEYFKPNNFSVARILKNIKQHSEWVTY